MHVSVKTDSSHPESIESVEVMSNQLFGKLQKDLQARFFNRLTTFDWEDNLLYFKYYDI